MVAAVLALAGVATSSAVAAPGVDVNTSNDTRYACGGVDSVGGICINSPFDTLSDLLR